MKIDFDSLVERITQDYVATWVEGGSSFESEIIHDYIPSLIEDESLGYLEVRLHEIKGDDMKLELTYEMKDIDDNVGYLKIECFEHNYSLN